MSATPCAALCGSCSHSVIWMMGQSVPSDSLPMARDREAHAPKGRAASQRDLGRLEEGADKEAPAVQQGEEQSPAPEEEEALAWVNAGGGPSGKQLCSHLGSWWTPS